jgi:1-acyl-sn-glycerol-3-phosphate acyltransferase
MSLTYQAASRAFEVGFRVLGLRPQVHGLEHLPVTGPAIIASNHVGYLDFAFVMLGPPRPRREVRFLARGDLFERPLTGAALRTLRQIPVDAHGDPAATLRFARAALERGELVGLHPEGTVNPTFLPLRGRSGAIRLALQTGAPIIPTAVWGSQRLLTKWRDPSWPGRGIPVQVRYGAPYVPGEGQPAALTRDLIERITSLVETCVQNEAAPAGSWWVPAAWGGGAPRLADVAARLQAQEAERQERAQRRRQDERSDRGAEDGAAEA